MDKNGQVTDKMYKKDKKVQKIDKLLTKSTKNVQKRILEHANNIKTCKHVYKSTNVCPKINKKCTQM